MYKPMTVDERAIWNKSEQEWELGQKNSRGEEVGEWKWWAEEGHLCCHTFFDDNGLIEKAQRFHPNGEVSLDLVTVGERTHRTYYRTNADTSEYFPECVYTHAWKAVQNEGSPVSFSYFSKDGSLLNADKETLKDLLAGEDGETCDEALARYRKVIELHLDAAEEDEDAAYTIERHQLNFYRATNESDLKSIEEKIGYQLPPSYREFILENGLLSFGTDEEVKKHGDDIMGHHHLGFEPYVKKMEGWGLNADQKNLLMPIMIMGNTGHNDGSYYCIDFRSQDPNTLEAGIYVVRDGDRWELLQYPPKPYVGRGYDNFLRSLIDEKIDYLIGEMSQY